MRRLNVRYEGNYWKSYAYSCLFKLFGCLICVLMFGWIFFLFGHHLLCYVHYGLCTPLTYWYRRMPAQYDKINVVKYDDIDIEWNKANKHLLCNLPSDSVDNITLVDIGHDDETFLPLSNDEQTTLRSKYSQIVNNLPNIKKLIIIGIPHGGTTWFQKTLNKHPSINMYGEVLFGWTTNKCNAHYMTNDNKFCNWSTMKSTKQNLQV